MYPTNKTMKTTYVNWTLIPWDGNTELGYQCYRKSFHNGHVSVGIGEFNLICYSYGPNSTYSLSGTRVRVGGVDLTPEQAMEIVDRNNGRHNHKDNDPR